jgi:hypothetical protein
MSKEAAKENVMSYNEHRDTAVYESTHTFRLLIVRIYNQSHEAFITTLRCRTSSMDVKEVETALITYEQGRDVQRALNSAAGGLSTCMFPMNAGMAGRKLLRFACDGQGHHWKTFRATYTPEGMARLRARNIHVPRNMPFQGICAPRCRAWAPPGMTPTRVVAIVAAVVSLVEAVLTMVVDVSVPVGAVVVLQGASKCVLTGIVRLFLIKLWTWHDVMSPVR